MVMSIKITGMSKSFLAGGLKKKVLSGLDIEVGHGEIFALTGPNGAGKTTLLKILSTLILPDSGNASVAGFDLVASPREVRGSIGLVFDADRSFYQILSVADNLRFYSRLFGMSGSFFENRMKELSDSLGLSPWLETRVSHCSSGIRQRLAFARALIGAPKVMLVDEIARSLDPESRDMISSYVKRSASSEGTTWLVVTHDEDWARKNATSSGRLCNGVVEKL